MNHDEIIPLNIANPEKLVSEISDIEKLIQDISLDRRKKSKTQEATVPEIINFEKFTHEEILNIQKNLQLLSYLNGHQGAQLRFLIKELNNDEGNYLLQLYKWSEQNITQPSLSKIKNLAPPLLLQNASDTIDIYERLRLVQSHPDIDRKNYQQELLVFTASTLTDSDPDLNPKWINLVDKVFNNNFKNNQPITKIFDQIGFIPQELMTKQKFRGVGGGSIINAIRILKQKESDSDRGAINFERAKIINHLFISGNANTLRIKNKKNITLDSNGIFINLKDFHSHLPYGLITDAIHDYLLSENWIQQNDYDEIAVRKCSDNSDSLGLEKFSQQQLLNFAKHFKVKDQDTQSLIQELTKLLQVNPDAFASTVLKSSLTIPDKLISSVINSRDYEAIFSLLSLGETIGAKISKEELRQTTGLFESHQIMNAKDESYAARSGILHQSDYYNSVKIAKALVDSDIRSNPDEKFLTLVGQFKKSKQGDQHSFVEIMHNGKLAKILISEEKHIGRSSIKHFSKLEKFESKDYHNFEDSLAIFNYFSTAVDRAQNILKNKYKNWEGNFAKLAETGLHFLLTNVTEFYQEANLLYKKIKDNKEDEKNYTELIRIFIQAKNKYSDFFYQNTKSVAHHKEKFSPEIKQFDVVYDENFKEEAKGKTATDGFTPEFCDSKQSIRICLLNHKTNDPSESIPFHVEESCINALRIHRNRPLINVIGGCRKVDQGEDGIDPLDSFSESVMRIADIYKANVGVPGTDSGIGKTFGFKNLEYLNSTSHLPRSEKAHVFAINPGGNTFVPGNPYTAGMDPHHVFANSPVDSIITPFPAGWGMKGREKYKSPYLNHVAYMEAFYQRIGFEQPRVMVVGNGGLYSIVEINESLERDSDLILVGDSGRFAEITSCLLSHIEELDLSENQTALSRKILSILKNEVESGILKEFCTKDFGQNEIPENEDFEVYRSFFIEFLKIAKTKKDRIRITSLKNLDNDLNDYFKEKIT